MGNAGNGAASGVRKVALEISSHEILLVSYSQGRETEPTLSWRRETWLKQSSSLFAPGGGAELAAALTRLVEQEKLQGMPLDVALSGDFCVTRVVAGPLESVRAELRSLEDRSAMYLSLGSGNKVCTRREHSIDAKRSLAWLTVTNEITLQALATAAKAAGVKLRHIEHSLAGACRAVGKTGLDASNPVLVVEINKGGVDLGVSYQGRLLLDYRPGGICAKDQVADTVTRHLARIQRHCHRHFQFAAGELKKVVLCGDASEVATVREQFDKLGRMKADTLDLNEFGQKWNLVGNEVDGMRLASALGMLLADFDVAKSRECPDLMEPLLKSQRLPLMPQLIRVGWPIAAALLVWVGIAAAAGYESWNAQIVAEQVKEIQRSEDLLDSIKLRLTSADMELAAHNSVATGLLEPAWHELLASVGSSLPQGVWLDSLSCERDGSIAITGPSYSEDGVFEFIRNLKNVPVLTNIALEGTRAARLPSGPATIFDLRSEISKVPATTGGT